MDFDELFPFVIALVVAAFLFYGVIRLVSNSMGQSPSRQYKIDSHTDLQEQKWRMNDIRARQKQLIRDQQQKIRDLQRR